MRRKIPTQFYCSKCRKWIPTPAETLKTGTGGVGYARDPETRRKTCYLCCAEVDRQYMRDHGKVTLYLTGSREEGFKVSNWPGTLVFSRVYVRKGQHNIARTRWDVWFNFEGFEWYGVQYGENTQLVHCKRTKTRV